MNTLLVITNSTSDFILCGIICLVVISIFRLMFSDKRFFGYLYFLFKFERIRKRKGEEAAVLAFKGEVVQTFGYLYSRLNWLFNVTKYIALHADTIYLKTYVENAIWIDESLIYKQASFERYKVFIDAVFSREERRGDLYETTLRTLASPEKIAYYEEAQKRYLYE